MITLTVLSFNGAPAAGSLSTTFDELGGAIGRADTNQLVLPDPERTISRVHAQVVFRGGGYALINRGSNPISIDGRPLDVGQEAPLAPGNQVQIGGYLIEAQVRPTGGGGAPRAAHDPFADLSPDPCADPFADLLGPAARPAAATGAAVADPFAAFASAPAPPAPAPKSSPGGIPDDWDPFAPDPAPAAQGPGRAPAAPFGQFGLDSGAGAAPALIPEFGGHGMGNGNTGGDSIDQLFGLQGASLGAGGDPLANSVLDAPMSRPNMAASHDPLQSLSAAPRATAQTQADTLSDLQRPFIAPETARKPAPAPVSVPMPAAPPATPALPAGAVLSWDDSPGDGRTVIHPRGAGRAPAPAVVAAPLSPPPAPRPAAPSAATAPPAAARATHADGHVAALLAAFRQGLATPSVQVDALTPELMELVGQLLREAARGTVDLLVARAALKREIRAETTMIVARENNPLKFSPGAEAALGHLLAPPTRGFMAAAPAMRDAYDDLRAHQFGFVAGMRAALEGVLGRFDPALLEDRLTPRSGLQSLLPGGRKARLWELFTELYAQIRTEAADDFHNVFGKAFLQAYEEHIERLQSTVAGDAR